MAQDKYVMPDYSEDANIYSVQHDLDSNVKNANSSEMSPKKAWLIGSGVMAGATALAVAYAMSEKDARPVVTDTGLETRPGIVEKDQTGFGTLTLNEILSNTDEATDLAVVNPINEASMTQTAQAQVAPTETSTSEPTPTVQAVAVEPTVVPTIAVTPTNTVEPTPAVVEDRKGIVAAMNGENLNLRNNAGDVIGKIAENSEIIISGITGDGLWLMVTSPDNKVGFVSSQFVSGYNVESLPIVLEDTTIELTPTPSAGIGGGGVPEPVATVVVADAAPVAGNVAVPAAPVVGAPVGNPVFPALNPEIPQSIGVEGLKPGEAIYNVETFVDEATNVLKASGEFVNTLGFGTEMMLAERGVVMISDFVKADGTLDQDLMTAYAQSQGRIELINPANQHTFTSYEPEGYKVPEQAFTIFAGRQYRIDLPDGRFIEVAGGEGVVWHTTFRGLFGDSTVQTSVMNTNRHTNVTISNHIPGNTIGTMYPEGAFISQGHYEQIIQDGHLDEDCGDGGCSRVMNLFVDLNTGAYLVFEHNYVTGQYTVHSRNFN